MSNNEPKIVSVWNLKGGAGKTTTAVNLAGELSRRGLSVCLLDMDTQGSSSDIYTAVNFSIYKEDEQDLCFKHDYVIVDHPPALLGSEIVGQQDLVVIPVQPSMHDYHATVAALGPLRNEKKLFIANRFISNARDHSDFIDVFNDEFGGFERMSDSRAYQSAANRGCTVSDLSFVQKISSARKACGEVSFIAERVLSILNDK